MLALENQSFPGIKLGLRDRPLTTIALVDQGHDHPATISITGSSYPWRARYSTPSLTG
jgi:hypothetical protein